MNEPLRVEKPNSPSSHGVWETLREAIRGSHQDPTEGSVGRAIILLAVPMVMEMSMESLFAVVDVFWVSKLGADAVTTVGITESMMAILYAVAMGLSMAATATVARRIGEKKPREAATAAVQVIAVGFLLSVPIGVAGVLLAPRLLTWMGAPAAVIEHGWRYTATMLGGNATILLLFLINAIFRGAGDAAIAMRVLWFANFLNIVLGPCFIFGLGPFPQMGVVGASVATNIGRGCGVLFQLYVLSKAHGRIQILRENLHLEPQVMLRLLRLSGNGMLQMFIGTSSWIGLVRILTSFGSAAVAGYTIAIRIIVFAILPAFGLCNAAATMVGQGLGAGKPERAERAVWIAGFYNMIFLGTIGLVFVIFAGPIIKLFIGDPEVIPFGTDCLRFVSCGFLLYGYGMVTTAAFNGAGDTFTPTMINLGVFWLFEIPLAFTLARPLRWGPRGVFSALVIAFSTYALVGIFFFRLGRWKKKVV